MIQLYFLSVLCNGLCGYILFYGNDGETVDKQLFPVNIPTFNLILGIVSIVTGVLKLLSPTMDRILILGDLVPAAAGVIAGFLRIFGIYRKDTFSASSSEKSLDNISASLLRFRKPIGLGLIAIALVHFLFPAALFL
jgi:hypothetical protein